MSDASAAAELLAHAREFASSGTDLYALLGVDATTSKADVHRAWRKASLKYHPDKAGDRFDPEKWQQFERARDVLADPPAREEYDAQRSADLIREQARMAMDDKKRRMVEDLEAREKAGRDAQRQGGETAADGGENAMSEAERRKTAEAGRRRVEERQRLMREAEEREKQRAAEKDEADRKREADLERRIGEIRAKKAAKTAAARQQQQQEEDVEMTDQATAAAVGEGHAAQSTTINTQGETRPHVLEALQKAEKLAAEAAAIPRVRGDFSHTYARLKAAQAAKEARQLAGEGMAV